MDPSSDLLLALSPGKKDIFSDEEIKKMIMYLGRDVLLLVVSTEDTGAEGPH
jgi:hypothetical protein